LTKEKKVEKTQLELLLISAGLNKKEAQIYLYLLEKGPTKALTIFEKLKMKKGNTYALLEKLTQKGFILKKGPLFSPNPPQTIFFQLEEKAEMLNNSLNNFKSLLPKLNSMYKLSLGKPTIRYYEGKEGLVEVFKDVYSPKTKPVYGAVDADKIEEIFLGLSEGKLIPTRLKTGLKVKVLFNDTPLAQKLHQMDKKQLRESILLDKEKYPLPAEIESYEDKVALMSFKKGDFLGLIIENEEFALTLRSILKFLFDHLRSCKNSKK